MNHDKKSALLIALWQICSFSGAEGTQWLLLGCFKTIFIILAKALSFVPYLDLAE